MKFIETERLFLRNLEASDCNSIHDYRNNEICNKYQRWDDFTQEDIEAFIARFKDDVFMSTKEEQHYAICKKETSELVGELAYFYTEGDCITLGITISYQYHKQGFASEVLQEVIRLTQEHHPDMDIVGLIERDNDKSIALFEKLGFKQECYAESMASYVYVIYA